MTKERKQSDFLKKEIRDLSDQISDMKDDLQTLDMYDSGAFGKFLSSSFRFINSLCSEFKDVKWRGQAIKFCLDSLEE